jgi:hypothetical protein
MRLESIGKTFDLRTNAIPHHKDEKAPPRQVIADCVDEIGLAEPVGAANRLNRLFGLPRLPNCPLSACFSKSEYGMLKRQLA